MNNIPVDFHFSPNNLQDYVDCARRFELRQLLRQQWPALQSEPALEFERRAELGRRFHEMVQQAILGIPVDQIASLAADPELANWWAEFSNSNLLVELPASRYAEYTLSAPFSGYRLVAKVDLLAIEPGRRAVIVDWKTSGKPLANKYLANRLQTRVYPFLLVEAGLRLNGGQNIQPDQVEMIYWFVSDPGTPVTLRYSTGQYQADREYLAGLVREIAARPAGSFSLTLDEKKCLYCVYRSLCNRGVRAGNWLEQPDELEPRAELELPFEQIGEIEF